MQINSQMEEMRSAGAWEGPWRGCALHAPLPPSAPLTYRQELKPALGDGTEAHHARRNQVWTPRPAPVPVCRTEGGASTTELLITLRLLLARPPCRSHQSRLARIRHCQPPGESKGWRSFISGTGAKDQVLGQKMLLVPLSLRKSQGFRSQERSRAIYTHTHVTG